MQTFDWTKTGVKGEVTYSTFGCNVFQESNYPTPDRVTPTVRTERHTEFGGRLIAPDGKEIRYWSFRDPLSADPVNRGPVYPSPTLRYRVGQVVHSYLNANKNAHTIHHHGIEPTTVNDGVGHVSFEVGTEYTYQFKPHRAGTFFYHCHRNTPLHFEMGMFGVLIVDPVEGPGTLYSGGPKYQVEKVWCLDDMDPRWHELTDHDAGLCGEDVGLNRFDPKYFLLSGVFNNKTTTDPRSVVTAKSTQRILIRLINASYSVVEVTLSCDSTCQGMDGKPLNEAWCKSYVLPKNEPFYLTSAQRRDLIIGPLPKGTYTAKFRFLHWVTGEVQDNGKGVLESRIIVS